MNAPVSFVSVKITEIPPRWIAAIGPRSEFTPGYTIVADRVSRYSSSGGRSHACRSETASGCTQFACPASRASQKRPQAGPPVDAEKIREYRLPHGVYEDIDNGCRRLHRRLPRPVLARAGRRGSCCGRRQAFRRVVSGAGRCGQQSTLTCKDLAACREAVAGCGDGVQPRRRHGRHGLHREQQGAVHALRADQHAPADGRTRSRRASDSSTRRRPASTPPTSRRRRRRRGRSRKRTPIPPCPKTVTAGRSFSASACAGTSARTSGSSTRIARYHNVYGPHGTWDGGREKAPAAICRKVIEAKLSGPHEIEIWGDGKQTRSFMYIDDCLKGTQHADASDIIEPINLGSDELVSINQLVDIVEEIAGIKLKRIVQPRRAQRRDGPQQRQHDDPARARLGAAHRACATGWRRRIPGSTTRWRPASRRTLDTGTRRECA